MLVKWPKDLKVGSSVHLVFYIIFLQYWIKSQNTQIISAAVRDADAIKMPYPTHSRYTSATLNFGPSLLCRVWSGQYIMLHACFALSSSPPLPLLASIFTYSASTYIFVFQDNIQQSQLSIPCIVFVMDRDLEEVGNFTKPESQHGQDVWLPITESRNGNAYYSAFHTLSSGIGVQALVLPVSFVTLGW